VISVRVARSAALALAFSAVGCDGQIVVGADRTDGAVDAGLTPLVVPWSTGFENGWADWSQPANQGYCYAMGFANFQIVNAPGAPVHSGQHAAAFTVNVNLASPSQTRCVRQGVLPASAYYGAWYYVPASATNRDNWNLLHFRGGNVGDRNLTHGLWDVSLTNGPGGGVEPSVYDFLRTQSVEAGPPIPIGTWFHLEVLWRRASDASGQFTVFGDGQIIFDRSGVATDDSLWGQWFVGNYATALTPGVSTVYVDDVTIGTTRAGP
jgi:hypothetical protein